MSRVSNRLLAAFNYSSHKIRVRGSIGLGDNRPKTQMPLRICILEVSTPFGAVKGACPDSVFGPKKSEPGFRREGQRQVGPGEEHGVTKASTSQSAGVYTTAQHNLRRVAVGERSREEVEYCAGFGNFRSNAAFGPDARQVRKYPFRTYLYARLACFPPTTLSQFTRQKTQNCRIRTLHSPLQFVRLPLRYHVISEDHGVS